MNLNESNLNKIFIRRFVFIFFTIVTLLILGCESSQVYTPRNEYGKVRIRKTGMNLDASKVHLKQLYNLVDTLAVYRLVNTYFFEGSGSGIRLDQKADQEKTPTYFLKFYSQGRMGRFSWDRKYKLNRNAFNPKKADMNYIDHSYGKFIIEKNNEKATPYFIEIVGDTLFQKSNDKWAKNRIYVKDKSVPKEFFQNWKPDW